MAGNDFDNGNLLYPIKVTQTANAIYEACEPSAIETQEKKQIKLIEKSRRNEPKSNDNIYDNWQNCLLWNVLQRQEGCKLEVVVKRKGRQISDVFLKNIDTNEIVLDAQIYTLCSRTDAIQ